MSYSINSNKFLNQAEIAELDGTLAMKECRDSILIELARRTGARASELLNLKKGDIIESSKSVQIIGLKGSNDRLIPVSKMFSKLKAYVETVDGDLVFPITYRRLAQVWDLYKPSNKSFKALRHTFAIELFTKTDNIILVQLALGHKDIRNTMVYMQYVYSAKKMRQVEVVMGALKAI